MDKEHVIVLNQKDALVKEEEYTDIIYTYIWLLCRHGVT